MALDNAFAIKLIYSKEIEIIYITPIHKFRYLKHILSFVVVSNISKKAIIAVSSAYFSMEQFSYWLVLPFVFLIYSE